MFFFFLEVLNATVLRWCLCVVRGINLQDSSKLLLHIFQFCLLFFWGCLWQTLCVVRYPHPHHTYSNTKLVSTQIKKNITFFLSHQKAVVISYTAHWTHTYTYISTLRYKSNNIEKKYINRNNHMYWNVCCALLLLDETNKHQIEKNFSDHHYTLAVSTARSYCSQFS